jgi:hypothetical protein
MDPMQRYADFSPDRRYRYFLARRWREGPCLVYCGMNPSRGDESGEDPTLRRMIGFANRDGFGAITVVNLFGLVSVNPQAVFGATDPVGEENDQAIAGACTGREVRKLVACWGLAPAMRPARVETVLTLLRQHGDVYCLGRTIGKFQMPLHPLRLRSETPFELYARKLPPAAAAMAVAP